MNTETKSPDQQAASPRSGCCCGPMMMGGGQEDAQAILDRRYAKGEITKEQYEEMKRELQR
jgi:Short C-terminal domain